jgi:hypothetical protein
MAITVKGRHTIRANTPQGRQPRIVSPWTLEAKENTTLAQLEKSYLAALDAVDKFEANRIRAEKSGTLTATGIVSDSLQFAASTLAPQLRKAKQAVEQARREVESRRAKLTLKPADKTDAAAQLRRLWKLDKFNALPEAERNQYLAKVGDNLDPELQQAILEAPEHTKMLPTDIEAIHMRALTRQHGEKAFAELTALEEGIKIAADVVEAAREEIALEVGGRAKLDATAAPYEKMIGSEWLRKVEANGVEEVRAFNIRNGRGYWEAANEEQLENGNFYASADEWRMANAGVVPPSMTKTNGAGT